jgi:hypothetical protein
MSFINAVSISPDGRAWLEDSRAPIVLHVFEHACNLMSERREVLSVVTSQIGDGPFNLVIDEDVQFSKHLTADTSISVRADELALGDLTIATTAAPLWSPRPNWEALHARKDSIIDQLTALPLTAYQPALPSSLMSPLFMAVAAADLAAGSAAARGLAGRGVGLTPAGDDLILGALYAGWLIHPCETARAIAQEFSEAAATLTTSLSSAWLRSAGKGEASVVWHRLFDALVAADRVHVQKTLGDIQAVGETSGADALTGFLSVLHSACELRIPKIH